MRSILWTLRHPVFAYRWYRYEIHRFLFPLFVVVLMLTVGSPALAQQSTAPQGQPLTLAAGSGYDGVTASGVFGEAFVYHRGWGWSVGGGVGLPHGEGRVEGGLHLLNHQVDGIPRFAVGVTGFFVAPVEGYSDTKAVTGVGTSIVFHVTPIFRFSAEYFHVDHSVIDAPANRHSGWTWSAMILLPFYTNAD